MPGDGGDFGLGAFGEREPRYRRAAQIVERARSSMRTTSTAILRSATARSPNSKSGNENAMATDASNRVSNCSAMV